MAQIMEADERQSRFSEQGRKLALQDMVGAKRATYSIREDQTLFMPLCSEGSALLVLVLPMATQHGNRHGGQRDFAAAP